MPELITDSKAVHRLSSPKSTWKGVLQLQDIFTGQRHVRTWPVSTGYQGPESMLTRCAGDDSLSAAVLLAMEESMLTRCAGDDSLSAAVLLAMEESMLTRCSGDDSLSAAVLLAMEESMLTACARDGSLEIPEETRRPVASSGTSSTCENPGATPPGIELGSPWWEATKDFCCGLRFESNSTLCDGSRMLRCSNRLLSLRPIFSGLQGTSKKRHYWHVTPDVGILGKRCAIAEPRLKSGPGLCRPAPALITAYSLPHSFAIPLRNPLGAPTTVFCLVFPFDLSLLDLTFTTLDVWSPRPKKVLNIDSNISRVRIPYGWHVCWTMPLVGGFSRGSPCFPRAAPCSPQISSLSLPLTPVLTMCCTGRAHMVDAAGRWVFSGFSLLSPRCSMLASALVTLSTPDARVDDVLHGEGTHGRCRWSVGFLGVLPAFPALLHARLSSRHSLYT
ncbi:hypothetical protein PR048_032980 [Dryococelus australis]|uniref:Uncharacterized protein n=1 Tax=Dryococelus australis TaxID=614101 RepID=A0ABQ9G6P4_9NEOP|nr:hypothetical protein PR048_032980 [Dryococelus australis]